MNVAIIGAGASGCFCAIEIKRRSPESQVTVFEAGPKPLAKLALTGGGRCNMTNSFAAINSLKDVYPRGHQVMKHILKSFGPEDCRKWFAALSIASFIQEDQRVFPVCQDAKMVVRALERELRRLGVTILCNSKVHNIKISENDIWTLTVADKTFHFDKVLVCSGGGALRMLEGLKLPIEPPVPSLFTLKIHNPSLNGLTGISIPDATLGIPGTNFKSSGALLLTDWGISGPATLKITSYAARYLYEKQYNSNIYINWCFNTQDNLKEWFNCRRMQDAGKLISNTPPSELPERLWKHILKRTGLREDLRWAEIGLKGLNKLRETLCADIYPVSGRARFKEEFVTAGGISLSAIDQATMESRQYRGLFFAGEVLDIDAITGGFNLQAAWSTAYTAATGILKA